MAKHKYFVAGTDTDAGKTLIATGLLEAARRQGLSTAAIKPVAAGCEEGEDGLVNADALALMGAMTEELPYYQVNPVALKEAIAPHIAAAHEQRALQVSRLAGYCNGTLMSPCDWVVVEGAGGWRVPLNHRETMARLAQELRLPVILVVGMKLGCINHALLTAEAIARDELTLAGWVANRIDPDMRCYDENVATLKSLIAAPCLGEVPWLETPDITAVADCLDLTPLLG